MTKPKHLPECPCPTDDDDPWYCCAECNPNVTPPWERGCICDRLRACEQRVTHKEFLFDEGDLYREVYRAGYHKGVAAAREVVSWTQDVDDALDAINALAEMDDPREPKGLPEPLPPSIGVPMTPMWPRRGDQK